MLQGSFFAFARNDRKGNHCAFNTSINASCGILIRPMLFIRFFPSFCFSRSLRFRVISPP